MKKVFKSKAYKDKLKGHKDGLLKVYSPDGVESRLLLSASKDGCIRAWDLVERTITAKLLLSRESLDSASVANYGDNTTNYEYNNNNNNGDNSGEEEESGQTRNTKATQEWMSAMCFSSNCVFGGYDDGVICSWSMKSGDLKSTLKGHTKSITELEMVNQTLLASASLDSTIRLWDIQSGLNETTFHMSGPVNLMKIVGGKTIQAIVDKHTFVEISIASLKIVQSVRFMSTSITSFITYENQLIIATTQNVMEVYALDALDAPNLQPTFIVEINRDWVLCMKELSGYLYTGGDDRRIKVWDLKNKLSLVEDFVGHEDGVVCIDFADNMLYSGSFDHSIRSWNLTEMDSRIREREHMFKEDIWSRKYDAWYKVFYKKKKKKGKKGSKKK